jgi:hypothetical protein
MKYILIVLILLLSGTAWAVDTCKYDKLGIDGNGVRIHRWWISEDNDAGEDYAATACASPPIFGWLFGFKIVPSTGTNPPDGGWALTLKNDEGYDFLYGEGAVLDGSDATDSANIDTPVTDAGGWPYLMGERLYPSATGMGPSSQNDFWLYISVQEFRR